MCVAHTAQSVFDIYSEMTFMTRFNMDGGLEERVCTDSDTVRLVEEIQRNVFVEESYCAYLSLKKIKRKNIL